MLKKVDLNAGPGRLTIMAYGPSGTGKTHFLGGAPRPVIFADATEGGWATIQHMGKENWWEPNFTPEVYAIEKPSDLIAGIAEVDKRVRLHPGEIRTVCVDSLTFIGDSYLAALERAAAESQREGKGVDPRQIYGRLVIMLRELMIRVHAIPNVHVIWTALAKEPDKPGDDGGILLAGQTRGKAPAACALWAYFRNELDGDELKFYMHTSRYGSFPARGRFADKLPSVMPPTFAAIDKALNLQTPRARKTVVQVPAKATRRV